MKDQRYIMESKKIFIALGVLLLIGVIAYIAYTSGSRQNAQTNLISPTVTVSATPAVSGTISPTVSPTGSVTPTASPTEKLTPSATPKATPTPTSGGSPTLTPTPTV